MQDHEFHRNLKLWHTVSQLQLCAVKINVDVAAVGRQEGMRGVAEHTRTHTYTKQDEVRKKVKTENETSNKLTTIFDTLVYLWKLSNSSTNKSYTHARVHTLNSRRQR